MMAQAMRRVWRTVVMPSKSATGLCGGRAQLRGLGQPPLGGVDPSFQGVGRFVHRPLREGRQADEIGDVLDGPVQPAGLREALEAVPLLGEEAIGQAWRPRSSESKIIGRSEARSG